MNLKISLLSSLMILPSLLFSSVELNKDNSCATPFVIPQLNGITTDVDSSEDYSNKHSKDIYLSFTTGVDGNFSMEILKDNDKKMKYQLFIGKSCDALTLVEKPEFNYTHNINLAVSSKQKYIIKVVKHSNGNSRYNISYNFKAVEALPLEELVTKIKNNETVSPNVVVATLKAYYTQFDADTGVAATLPLTPIFHLLNDNYSDYKSMILDMYSDKTNHRLLRMPMLNIIKYHLDDTASLNAVKAVFGDKSDDSLVVGQSAKLLSKKGVDISDEVEKRYPTSDSIVKRYYVQILALFKPLEARKMIEEDMNNETEGNRKIKLINAFTKTGVNDDYVVNKLEDMLYNTIPNSTYHDVEKEIISIAITINLAESDRDDRFNKLLDIASTSSFSEGTRANALLHLYAELKSNTTVDKNHIKSRLEQLSQAINSAQTLEQHEKDFLQENIMRILDSLQGV